jgi:hypothetical protein
MSTSTNDPHAALRRQLAHRHYFIGWTSLLLFLSMGAFLEGMHGFKVGFYLDPNAKLRREMWTLAHAHGTLLALVQVAFATGLMQFGRWTPARLKLASFFLIDAAVLIPLGFFLGGLFPSESDPWIGVYLVPLGALLLFIAVGLIVLSSGLPPEDGAVDVLPERQRTAPLPDLPSFPGD